MVVPTMRPLGDFAVDLSHLALSQAGEGRGRKSDGDLLGLIMEVRIF